MLNDFEAELGALIEKWRHHISDDAILEGLDLAVLAVEERRELTPPCCRTGTLSAVSGPFRTSLTPDPEPT